MRYYKIIDDDYIKGVGYGCDGIEINEQEYNQIFDFIKNRPVSDIYGYKLRANFTWEEYLLPVEEEMGEDE